MVEKERENLMNTFLWLIFLILMIIGYLYTFNVMSGNDNYDGINIQLNDWYKENDKATIAAIEELKKQGKNCEIIKLSKSFSEVIVEDKKYYVTLRGANLLGYGILQTIQLRPLK